jgi:predicted nucleic acid-binding protein
VLVIDASAAIEILIQSETGLRWRDRIVDESLYAPHLLDVEVMNGLRRLAVARPLLAQRAEQATGELGNLPIERLGHIVLLPRIWALRHNVSAYDATYIALAEALNAPLMTCDAKLSRSHGHHAKIVLLQ